MLFKILGVAIITTLLGSLLKNYKSEFSFLVNICGGLIILYILIDGVSSLVAGINFIGSSSSVAEGVISSLLKVVGAGYITEFCADIAEDSGNKFVASKVILGGKIAICIMAFPIIQTLFQTIISLI